MPCAVLTDEAAKTPPGGSGDDDGRVWAAVRWTDADGRARIGQAKVFPAPRGQQAHCVDRLYRPDRLPAPSATGATPRRR
ncbi:hypothetical protein ACWDE9_37645 [Streptomyces olivaceoviridis]